MEARKITVVQTKNQRKSVIMSAATTLAELKADLRNNGIDYDGVTFFEGTSKTELKTDSSVLPHDVPYKGQVTNELVFMLTNTNKKIKSGTATMSRMEAYCKIKSMGLQDACVKKFGKNFTMCKTADLITLVENAQQNGSKPAPKVEAKKEEVLATPVEAAPVTPENRGGECVDEKARAAISQLVDILYDNGTIEEDEKDGILDILGGKVSTPTEEYKPKSSSSYSDDEIDDMFDFCR